MHPAFSYDHYVIKPHGLSIAGKLRLFDPQDQPVLFIEHKTRWSKPFSVFHAYTDEKKKQEVLLIQDGEHASYSDYFTVTDLASAEPVGGISVDWKKFFEDAWGIVDASGTVIGQVSERSTGRAILHELTEGVVPQVLDVTVGGQPVAELKQKNVILGHHLLVDFSSDTAGRLDHRLGLAIAILIAAHQAETGAE
jgi:hypothetical protein